MLCYPMICPLRNFFSCTEQSFQITGYLSTKFGASLDPRNPEGQISDSSIYRHELASKAWATGLPKDPPIAKTMTLFSYQKECNRKRAN